MRLCGQNVAEPAHGSRERENRAQYADGAAGHQPGEEQVIPNARTIGHAVGAGISTVFAALLLGALVDDSISPFASPFLSGRSCTPR